MSVYRQRCPETNTFVCGASVTWRLKLSGLAGLDGKYLTPLLWFRSMGDPVQFPASMTANQ